MKHIVIILSALCWISCESSAVYEGIALPEQDSYELPTLSFDFGDLEPYIDARTVQTHHEGHVNNYRKKMNGILQAWREKVGEYKSMCYPGTCISLLHGLLG